MDFTRREILIGAGGLAAAINFGWLDLSGLLPPPEAPVGKVSLPEGVWQLADTDGIEHLEQSIKNRLTELRQVAPGAIVVAVSVPDGTDDNKRTEILNGVLTQKLGITTGNQDTVSGRQRRAFVNRRFLGTVYREPDDLPVGTSIKRLNIAPELVRRWQRGQMSLADLRAYTQREHAWAVATGQESAMTRMSEALKRIDTASFSSPDYVTDVLERNHLFGSNSPFKLPKGNIQNGIIKKSEVIQVLAQIIGNDKISVSYKEDARNAIRALNNQPDPLSVKKLYLLTTEDLQALGAAGCNGTCTTLIKKGVEAETALTRNVVPQLLNANGSLQAVETPDDQKPSAEALLIDEARAVIIGYAKTGRLSDPSVVARSALLKRNEAVWRLLRALNPAQLWAVIEATDPKDREALAENVFQKASGAFRLAQIGELLEGKPNPDRSLWQKAVEKISDKELAAGAILGTGSGVRVGLFNTMRQDALRDIASFVVGATGQGGLQGNRLDEVLPVVDPVGERLAKEFFSRLLLDTADHQRIFEIIKSFSEEELRRMWLLLNKSYHEENNSSFKIQMKDVIVKFHGFCVDKLCQGEADARKIVFGFYTFLGATTVSLEQQATAPVWLRQILDGKPDIFGKEKEVLTAVDPPDLWKDIGNLLTDPTKLFENLQNRWRLFVAANDKNSRAAKFAEELSSQNTHTIAAALARWHELLGTELIEGRDFRVNPLRNFLRLAYLRAVKDKDGFYLNNAETQRILEATSLFLRSIPQTLTVGNRVHNMPAAYMRTVNNQAPLLAGALLHTGLTNKEIEALQSAGSELNINEKRAMLAHFIDFHLTYATYRHGMANGIAQDWANLLAVAANTIDGGLIGRMMLESKTTGEINGLWTKLLGAERARADIGATVTAKIPFIGRLFAAAAAGKPLQDKTIADFYMKEAQNASTGNVRVLMINVNNALKIQPTDDSYQNRIGPLTPAYSLNPFIQNQHRTNVFFEWIGVEKNGYIVVKLTDSNGQSVKNFISRQTFFNSNLELSDAVQKDSPLVTSFKVSDLAQVYQNQAVPWTVFAVALWIQNGTRVKVNNAEHRITKLEKMGNNWRVTLARGEITSTLDLRQFLNQVDILQ